jgi:phage terminase large subunit GpA-like protein
MKKIDNMLDTTGTRKLLKSNANRSKNNKSGDKDRLKEFKGGSLTLGPTNHKSLRQISIKYMLVDDFEAMKSSSKESGDTMSLIKRRTASFAKKRKIAIVSTPEIRETSNIEPEYEKGTKEHKDAIKENGVKTKSSIVIIKHSRSKNFEFYVPKRYTVSDFKKNFTLCNE